MSLTDGIRHFYESITPFQAAMALSVIFLYGLYLILRDMDVPPGPKGLPLFGYWPFLNGYTCHLQLMELSKKYGDVFSLRITGKLFICLNSLKAIKEAHLTKTDYFGGRFSEESILCFLFKEGIAFINGEPWKVLRKFFLSKFKEYGMISVKENVASSSLDALKETLEELRGTKGQPILITDIITMKCMMVIRRILFNDNGITKAELQECNDLYAEMMKGMTGTNLILTGTFAKYFIFPFMPSNWIIRRYNKRIEGILFDVIKRHKTEYNESHVVDIVDSYFKERDERRKRGDPTAAYLTDKALVASLVQFITDGVLSVGIFIGCFLVALVENPEEQEKIYKEILDVVGQDRLPTLDDKNKLPYTNAFIYEVTRLSDFFPIVPSLECTKETTLRGYKIPKGCATLVNMYGANRNPEDFENPDEFNPSRYIATADKPRAELPILFGVGKRSCIGEAFTMNQTFLFLTTIVQNFQISLPDDAEGSFMFWAKKRGKICVYPRSQKSY